VVAHGFANYHGSPNLEPHTLTLTRHQVRDLEDCLHSLAVVGAWPAAEGAPPLTVALLRAARPQMLNAHAATHFQLLRIVWSVAALEVLRAVILSARHIVL